VALCSTLLRNMCQGWSLSRPAHGSHSVGSVASNAMRCQSGTLSRDALGAILSSTRWRRTPRQRANTSRLPAMRIIGVFGSPNESNAGHSYRDVSLMSVWEGANKRRSPDESTPAPGALLFDHWRRICSSCGTTTRRGEDTAAPKLAARCCLHRTLRCPHRSMPAPSPGQNLQRRSHPGRRPR
jgi:hypothetical protein